MRRRTGEYPSARLFSGALLCAVLLASCTSSDGGAGSVPVESCIEPICVAALDRVPFVGAIAWPEDMPKIDRDIRRTRLVEGVELLDSSSFLLVTDVGLATPDGENIRGPISFGLIQCSEECVVLGPFEGVVEVDTSSEELERVYNKSLEGVEVLSALPVGTLISSEVLDDWFSADEVEQRL